MLLTKSIHEADIDEIEAEKKRFKAMCFIQRADEGCYIELFEKLKKGVFERRDEYPKTIATAYELLLRTSKQIGYK